MSTSLRQVTKHKFSHLDKGAESVKLFLRVLVIIALSCEAYANPVGNILDALAPQELVEFLVYAHIRGSHRFLCESSHSSDSAGSTLAESPAQRNID